MRARTACLIINPRSGTNVARLADIGAVFAAAGWKTHTALREFGGHTARLARDAAEAGYDLIIGYGGDGTLNQVVNGVMAAKHRRTVVAVLPGGTANVWAHEIGMPEDAVLASLLLVNSVGRRVDLGRVEAAPFIRPPRSNGRRTKDRRASGDKHHFLLMAGLGVDAAILRRVSTSLKERIGDAAVALAAVRELPSQHGFPVEIRTSGPGQEDGVLWAGEALQVIVGNTRRYGNITEVTPQARLDDGILDVCVVTAGAPLTTMEQILSILLHRRPGNGRSEHFQGAHFRIRVPASVGLQLDGSRVKRRDRFAAPDRKALRDSAHREAVMVTYRFDAVPSALRVAIPCTYGGALFGEAFRGAGTPEGKPGRGDQEGGRGGGRASGGAGHEGPGPIAALLERGRKVTVVGVGPDPARQGTWIVAGATTQKETGDSRPVAVRIDRRSTLLSRAGEALPAGSAAGFPKGGVLVVDGAQSKRRVIRATRVVVT